MKKIIFLFVAFVLIGSEIQAKKVITPEGDKELTNVKTTSLSGIVLDTETGEPLVGVAIRFEGSNRTFYTDFDGSFLIENIIPGTYNILSSYISYCDNKLKKVNLGHRKNLIRFELKKDQTYF